MKMTCEFPPFCVFLIFVKMLFHVAFYLKFSSNIYALLRPHIRIIFDRPVFVPLKKRNCQVRRAEIVLLSMYTIYASG